MLHVGLLLLQILHIAAYRHEFQGKLAISSRRLAPLYTSPEEPPQSQINLLKEEINELKDGIQEFQANTFQQLYNKKVMWEKDDDQEISESSTTWRENQQQQSNSTSTPNLSTTEISESSSTESTKFADIITTTASTPASTAAATTPATTAPPAVESKPTTTTTIVTPVVEVEKKKEETVSEKPQAPPSQPLVTSSAKDPAAVITELLLKTQKIPQEIQQNTLSPELLAKQQEKEEEEKIYKAQSVVSTNFIQIMKELNKEAKEKELKDFQRRTTTTSVEPAIVTATANLEEKKVDLKEELKGFLKVDQLLNKKDEKSDFSNTVKKAETIIEQETVTPKTIAAPPTPTPPAVKGEVREPLQRSKPFEAVAPAPSKPKKWFEKVLGFLENDANIVVQEEPTATTTSSTQQKKREETSEVAPKVVKEVVEAPKVVAKPVVVDRPVAGKVSGREERPVAPVTPAIQQPKPVTPAVKREEVRPAAVSQPVAEEKKKSVFGKLFSFLESDPNIVAADPSPPPRRVAASTNNQLPVPPAVTKTAQIQQNIPRPVAEKKVVTATAAATKPVISVNSQKIEKKAEVTTAATVTAEPAKKAGGFFGFFGKKEEEKKEQEVKSQTQTSRPVVTKTDPSSEYRPVVKVGVKKSVLSAPAPPQASAPASTAKPVTPPAAPFFSKPVVQTPPAPPVVKAAAAVVPEVKKPERPVVVEDTRKPAKGILGWFGVKQDEEEERLAALTVTSSNEVQREVLGRVPSEPRPVAAKRREEPTKQTEKKKEGSSSGGGLFGLFGSKNAPATSTSASTTAAPIAARPVAAKPPAKTTVTAPQVPVKTVAPVVKPVVPAPVKPVAPSPVKPVVTPPPRPVIATPKPAVVATPVKVTPPTIAPKPATTAVIATNPTQPAQKTGGGLFGLFGGGGEVKKTEEKKTTPPSPPAAAPVKVAAVAVTAATTTQNNQKGKGPASMNINFQRMITKALNGDVSKINSFQKLTDNYRSGNLDARQFIVSIERLFLSPSSSSSAATLVNLDNILLPLINELPEKDAATKLKNGYEKYRKEKTEDKAKEGGGGGGGGLFGWFGGAKQVEAKEVVKQAVKAPSKPSNPTPTTITAAVKSSAPPAPQKASTVPVSASSSSSSITTVNGLRVPDKVPLAKKAIVAKQLQLVNENKVKAKEVFDYLVREIGETRVKAINNDIANILSKDKFNEYDKLVKALK